MLRAILGIGMTAVMLWAGMAAAQQQSWVQVEAQPTLAEAEVRASAYAAAFPDVVGYRLGSRWYGIALGPYSPDEAAERLADLRRENLIPRDSYVSDGTNFREQFWPVGAPQAAPLATPLAPDAPVDVAPLEPEVSAEVVPESASPEALIAEPETIVAEETPAQARAAEAALTLEERQELQRALQWDGFYTAGIDGAFGPGTRNSMAAYQTAMGLEPTGVLTTRQRDTLVTNWRLDVAEYGFETVSETESGIEITLPIGLVQFDHYEPPFVHYTPKTEGGMKVILISQPGDRAALYGLYDILQTLTIIPTTGERSRTERSFEINGASASTQSYAFAETRAGLVKGYILVWPPDQADQAARVLGQMKTSFRAVGNRALDPGMVPMTDATRRGLLAGLELRRPKSTGSGFYVDTSGRVLTTAEAVAHCGRITLDGVTEAQVTHTDTATGIALLTPNTPLAPPAVAGFQTATDRIGSEVAVAGYSYGDSLPAPVITFGVLEDVQGLNGETGVKRLGISTLPGDAGGPVLDGTGAVLGLLLPRARDPARVLPGGVEFVASGTVLAQVLGTQGIAAVDAKANGALAPEDLTRKATGMTVLVSCWE
ncbi:MAG: serine protease [Pseudotabrizicola sp.]|uniref:serine protease n=1 Tax=Pseudotabrizicola sp. TaxID=2939647 RepID=UPI002719B165|nr:serine protease [Pseudotabrizicola sp.]MDO8882832.1 serine protease [Pseudotabrizicola sp.]MDP2083457.1 serine protease [Pseudotabrizicola sp.]MDZ7572842.1 serine protease [Pseudotabrizicola sp.]